MRIAVLTSGGDSPGMNAAVRTLVVGGVARGHQVLGVRRGYAGLLDGDAAPLEVASVDGVSRLGGSILGSSRCLAMEGPDGQARARARLEEMGAGALVVIGGNGSLTGAHLLAAQGVQVVGLPASIDNDVGHTALAIGVDTAVNTIVDACDRISDTARAHRRAFVVEVMGRHCGFLAMRAGIAAEADAILYGEIHLSEDEIVLRLRDVLRRCFSGGGRERTRCLIVKSEGVPVACARLVERLRAHMPEDAPGVDIRETVLGHVVRGGSPSALDRLIAQRLGFAAVLACEAGQSDVMLAWDAPGKPGRETHDPSVRMVPLAEVLEETRRLLDGSSPVVRRRIALLNQVEGLLAL